jgi:hypothetical protein
MVAQLRERSNALKAKLFDYSQVLGGKGLKSRLGLSKSKKVYSLLLKTCWFKKLFLKFNFYNLN